MEKTNINILNNYVQTVSNDAFLLDGTNNGWHILQRIC